MSTMLEELQQMTNAQLCIMCHDYHITPGHITSQSRRELERRLLLAIIAERAKQRAKEQSRREQALREHYEVCKKPNNINNTAPRRVLEQVARNTGNLAPLPAPNAVARRGILRNATRHACTMTTPSVLQTSHIRRPTPYPLPTHQYQRSRPHPTPQCSETSTATTIASISSRLPMQLWRYQAARGLGAHTLPLKRTIRIEERRGGERRTAGAEWQRQSEEECEQYDQQDEEYNHYQLYAQQWREYAHRQSHFWDQLPIADNREHTQHAPEMEESDFRNNYGSFSSCSSSVSLLSRLTQNSQSLENYLMSASRLACLSKSAASMNQAFQFKCDDNTSQSEHELRTLNYLSAEEQLQLLAEKRAYLEDKEVLEIMRRRDQLEDSDDGFEIDWFVSEERQRHEPSFWRYMFQLICCNRYGKLDAEKIRCTILCCGMAVCVFMVYKAMH
ncbi:uncharacterized protein LOC115626553 [Scaptodrosophila lebanonensis]|uniref:Uncharacterized protein LOC115626553 n=1 Tax=Drosophila lebanonensis TaxID=7225 RepID=A0A6J2TMJ2_DROLE|nr:uncharacterized protein LOC115626553 [Scaptodrosophila lebanonensis]